VLFILESFSQGVKGTSPPKAIVCSLVLALAARRGGEGKTKLSLPSGRYAPSSGRFSLRKKRFPKGPPPARGSQSITSELLPRKGESPPLARGITSMFMGSEGNSSRTDPTSHTRGLGISYAGARF